MLEPLHKNEVLLQSASPVQSAVHAPNDCAQIPVEHVEFGQRVPVHAVPIVAPFETGAAQKAFTGVLKSSSSHTRPEAQQSESRTH
jgi:hypothetical protein